LIYIFIYSKESVFYKHYTIIKSYSPFISYLFVPRFTFDLHIFVLEFDFSSSSPQFFVSGESMGIGGQGVGG
jgi:hypothetical protein